MVTKAEVADYKPQVLNWPIVEHARVTTALHD
jgi:hypothetical protein